MSFRLCDLLSDIFPGSVHVRHIGLERADDHTIWRHARDNNLAIVLLDADFAEMAALLGSPPKVVWLRAGNQPTGIAAALLRRRLPAIQAFEVDAAACLEIY